ncbi:MAG: uridine diphosphate-N-acetylglucosamine-binding protein YvcK [Candidatus Omnitrophota bacterium]
MRLLAIGNQAFQREVGGILFRLNVEVETAHDPEEIREKLKWDDIDLVVFDYDYYYSPDTQRRLSLIRAMANSHRPFIVVSSLKDPAAIAEAKSEGASDYIVKPYNQREFILRFNALAQGKIRVSCIGGGTGLFTLLLGLKTLPDVLLTSIVSMSDDGGSSGKISQTFGILPPGDIRRSLVALSNAPELMNEIMQHRFEKGGELHGHSFGNIFLTVLAEVKGSMSEAVRALSDILNIQGIVLPAATTPTRLVARFEGGAIVKGESKIDLGADRAPDLHIEELWHEPPPECDADAYTAIMNADVVTIGPGDLFTSVITNLVIKNFRDAVVRSRAKKIYVCNLMTKPGETADFRALDHIREVLKYLGGDHLDAVLLSNTGLSQEAIEEYARKGQSPVAPGDLDEIRKLTKAEIVLADVGNETELVRHDSQKLKNEIWKIIQRIAPPHG